MRHIEKTTKYYNNFHWVYSNKIQDITEIFFEWHNRNVKSHRITPIQIEGWLYLRLDGN